MMKVNDVLVTTQDEFSEYKIVQTFGLAKGNTIRARHIGKDILAGLRSIVGGEIDEYTKVFAEAREQAIDRMMAEAKKMGANGVVCMRLTTSTVMQGAAELLAYGTAVKLEK
ncbi:MAG: YbjQ family protein [Bacteroidota bacterium]|nr:YbjQ family protein [Bacteroidota bacterium]